MRGLKANKSTEHKCTRSVVKKLYPTFKTESAITLYLNAHYFGKIFFFNITKKQQKIKTETILNNSIVFYIAIDSLTKLC